MKKKYSLCFSQHQPITSRECPAISLNGTASLTKYFYQDEGLKSSTG
jgi:hypothetical protein